MPKEITKPYEPTPEERAAIDAYFERKKNTVACPQLKVVHGNEGGPDQIVMDHPEPGMAWTLLTQALGATDPNFAWVLSSQLANSVGKIGLSPTQGLNFMLTVVRSIQPKSELESLLATQMAAVHVATMAMACRLDPRQT